MLVSYYKGFVCIVIIVTKVLYSIKNRNRAQNYTI